MANCSVKGCGNRASYTTQIMRMEELYYLGEDDSAEDFIGTVNEELDIESPAYYCADHAKTMLAMFGIKS